MLVAALAGPRLADRSSTRPEGTGPMAAMIGVLRKTEAEGGRGRERRFFGGIPVLMGGISTAIC